MFSRAAFPDGPVPAGIIRAMFLKAGALSLLLLLASRVLGLLRESVQAAAFGTSGLADLSVLMLALPDWLTGVAASGALAYVLVPAWAGRSAQEVGATQRRVAWVLVPAGIVAAAVLALGRVPAQAWLAGGLPATLAPAAAQGLVWSAVAFPLALLAALWGTRLQHERDFLGLYAANLVVNGALIAAIAVAGSAWAQGRPVAWLGAGLVAAMALRLVWQAWRLSPVSRDAHGGGTAVAAVLPGASVWLWAVLSAGLPLALPFVARSIASLQGEGALATFNYAWKLVELPLVLAIQLVATLAFPAVAAAVAGGLQATSARRPLRVAFALAWALACAAAAGLMVGADAVARLLFGWGRMDASALAQVAHWGRVAALGLLPQALAAVGLTVLASQQRLRPAAAWHALGLAALAGFAAGGVHDGARLMAGLNGVFALIALGVVLSLGRGAWDWIPWKPMAWPLAGLACAALAAEFAPVSGTVPGLLLAVLAAGVVMVLAWWGAGDLRAALRR